MKKNGFTLMELLGVIMILAILAVIAFPPIITQIKKSKQEIKNSTKILITDAAKDYYEDNINNFEQTEGMTYCIDLNTLINQGYLNGKLKDEELNNIDTTKKVKMVYHNSKFNYDVVNSCTKYTVTFDANGGTLSETTKEVMQGSVYGKLPTPTRSGYTFMGWNGKNLIYISDKTGTVYGLTYEVANEKIKIYGTNTYSSAAYSLVSFQQNLPVLDENKNYTLSISQPLTSGCYVQLNYLRTDGVQGGMIIQLKDSPKTANINNLENYNKLAQLFVGVYGATTSVNEEFTVQLEEGDTATPYEPYYITSDTKVVQQKDHTLKAIWQAN